MNEGDASPAQAEIIENIDQSRIRLVSAVPGSGKTWVVARAIEHEVGGRPKDHPGLAALSFTNVAKDELTNALGGTLGANHFVGTLDSFLFRFVLRPFLPVIVKKDVVWQVVPASTVRTANSRAFHHTIKRGGNTIARVNLFDCTMSSQGISVRHPKSRSPIVLTEDEAKEIRRKKRNIWYNFGLMSHSDAAYIAAKILEGPHGRKIAEFISLKFPFLVVDELQDTGESHFRCLKEILSDRRIRAVLVGDPDQSIYEFSGASPNNFLELAKLPDVTVFSLPSSRRCPSRICRIVTTLSTTNKPVEPLEPERLGRAILVIHEDKIEDITAFIMSLPEDARVIVRTNESVSYLQGSLVRTTSIVGSQPLQLLHRSVAYLIDGKLKDALNIGTQVLCSTAYGVPSPTTNRHLREREISRHRVRGKTMQLLLQLIPNPDTEPLLSWGKRARSALLVAAQGLPGGKPDGKKVKGPRNSTVGTWNIQRQRNIRAEISTVHRAKGETHNTTVYYIPKVSAEKCPSKQWWAKGEEQRVAFVACSRPRSTLVICVHRDTYIRLSSKRPDFTALFEKMTITEWMSAHETGTNM